MQDPHRLLPVAYRAAARVVNSPVLAEEAGERAVHLLMLAMIGGTPPLHPKAWLRVVARRSACALLRSDWARTLSVSHDDIARHQAPYRQPRSVSADHVREAIVQQLSPRQQEAVLAALSCNGARAAARSCGMEPRDYRRHLGAAARKARAAVAAETTQDVYADDAAVQFRLPS